MSKIVQMTDVSFSWKGSNPFTLRLETLYANRGESVLLLGPSGSGKSTFLSLLCGINTPDAGTVEVLDKDLKSLGNAGRDYFRAEHFGIIFQMFNLLPYGSVIDNVILPLSFARKRKTRVLEHSSMEEEAIRLLDRLGMEPENIHKKRASELSVGQQQRVAVARALIGSPDIIVADEPTSALDRQRQASFLELLAEEVRRVDATLIMVSHDETLAPNFDHVISMQDLIAVQREAAQ